MNLEKYTFPTKYGKLLSTQPFPNGNMLRATAELLILSPPQNSIEYSEGTDDCLVSDLQNHGLCYSRYPDRAENTSVDDLIAIGGLDFISAQNILNCARSNLGFYSVDGKRTWSQFIFRFQGLWAHLKIRAEEKLDIYYKLVWALSLYLAAQNPIENQDAWLLSHLMVITYERSKLKSWICDTAVKYWKSKKSLPSWQIMSYYLCPDCQDHPLIEAWRPYD